MGEETRRAEKARYHHGALQDALIEAASEIIAERGVEGFTLREAARRAGVSAAAPAHHFGSATGLLAELALRGFHELVAALQEAAEQGGSDPLRRLLNIGVAYVMFARAQPGRFQLMFRRASFFSDDERLQEAKHAAYRELDIAVRAYKGSDAADVDSVAIGYWAAAHGLAHLSIEGKFEKLGDPADAPRIAHATLASLLAR